MTDDSSELTPENIYHAQHQLDCKQTALDLANLAMQIKETRSRDEVCSEQAHEISEAAMATWTAARSVWPGAMPSLDELATYPDEMDEEHEDDGESGSSGEENDRE